MKNGLSKFTFLALAFTCCAKPEMPPPSGHAPATAEEPEEESVADNKKDQDMEKEKEKVTPPTRSLRVIPDNSFGGYIMNEGNNTCTYMLEFGGICQRHGNLGYPGRDITYEAFDGEKGRIFGYCDYEGVKVPVEAKFIAGQKFPDVYIGDTAQKGLVYTQMISREVPPEYWPAPEPCKESAE